LKSIKPGRGPSAMSAFGGIIAALFGVFWTVMASRMGAPFPFPLFGVLFTILAIAGVFYNYKNAISRDRMSLFDITDNDEERDPFHEYVINKADSRNNDMESNRNYRDMDHEDTRYRDMEYKDIRDETEEREIANYCPYCGKKVKKDYMFCPKCGRDVNK